MQPYEFLKFLPTPNEKHIGIATVRLYGKLILRYKIVPNKDGSGFYPVPASYKVPDPAGGSADHYIRAFMIDSEMEKEELESLIKSHVQAILMPPQSVAQPAYNSGYVAPQAPQQMQAQPQYQQQTFQQRGQVAQNASVFADEQCPF